MKWQQKTHAAQTLYKTLSLRIYGGGKIYLEKKKNLKTFLEGQGVSHGSSDCPPLKYALP